MAEPDHIFLKPLPNFAYGDYPVAFPFFYMKPAEHDDIIRKFFPKENGPITNVDPIGNSPVIIKKVYFYYRLLNYCSNTLYSACSASLECKNFMII